MSRTPGAPGGLLWASGVQATGLLRTAGRQSPRALAALLALLPMAGLGLPAAAADAAPAAEVAAATRLAAPSAPAGKPLWELGLGAAWVHLPHYRGSDQSRNWLLPVPYAVYRGKILRATREGARAVLLDSERLNLDVSVSGSAPTRSSDNRARSGMADLPATAEIGPNLNLTLARGADWKWDLRIPWHAVLAVGGEQRDAGWTLSPVLNLDSTVRGGWSLGLQGGPRWASARYHELYYGVAERDATAARPAYQAGGGFAGWRLTAAVSRRQGDWWLGGFMRADSVAGARFEDSPLVRQRHNLSWGLALSWVIKSSDERVADPD